MTPMLIAPLDCQQVLSGLKARKGKLSRKVRLSVVNDRESGLTPSWCDDCGAWCMLRILVLLVMMVIILVIA